MVRGRKNRSLTLDFYNPVGSVVWVIVYQNNHITNNMEQVKIFFLALDGRRVCVCVRVHVCVCVCVMIAMMK